MKTAGTYQEKMYGPAEQKTYTGALCAFFAREFPQLAGERSRQAIVQAIVEMTQRFFPETAHLRPGQTTWTTVAKQVSSAYGKTIDETPLVPVVLSVMAADEVTQRKQGKRLRELKIEAVGRLCRQADEQGGCLTNVEMAVLLKTTPTTISTYIREYENRHGELLPRRGTIHDLGPTLTHKKEICRLLFLEQCSVSETCRRTRHSPQAVNRYITNFRQVLTCKANGLDPQQTAFATKLSRPLVEEYHRLFDEYAVTDQRIAELIKPR